MSSQLPSSGPTAIKLILLSILLSSVAVAASNYRVLHAFSGNPDGGGPFAPVVFDGNGNLYGTTWGGGTYGYGMVFELIPSSGGWKEALLYSFCAEQGCPDGTLPTAPLVFDQAGNLYGATQEAIFELSPG